MEKTLPNTQLLGVSVENKCEFDRNKSIFSKRKKQKSDKMSDLFKSAMGYFNTGPINVSDNEFVGQIVEVGSVKLRVKRVIAEGWLHIHVAHFVY